MEKINKNKRDMIKKAGFGALGFGFLAMLPNVLAVPKMFRDDGNDTFLIDKNGNKSYTDLDFNKFKAIQMACDNGTSFPANPNTAQWFYRTDCKCLFIYEGAWKPMASFGDITLYTADVATGDETGYGSSNKVTPANLVAAIPTNYGGNITIIPDASTDMGSLVFRGKYSTGDFDIIIDCPGTIDLTTTLSANAGTSDHDGEDIYVQVSDSLSGKTYAKDDAGTVYFLETDGTDGGSGFQIFNVIKETDRERNATSNDWIYLQGYQSDHNFTNASPAESGDDVYIYQPNVIFGALTNYLPSLIIKRGWIQASLTSLGTGTTELQGCKFATAVEGAITSMVVAAGHSFVTVNGCYALGGRYFISSRFAEMLVTRSYSAVIANNRGILIFGGTMAVGSGTEFRGLGIAGSRDGVLVDRQGFLNINGVASYTPGRAVRIYGFNLYGVFVQLNSVGRTITNGIYYGPIVVSSTTTSTPANQLVDTATNFVTAGISVDGGGVPNEYDWVIEDSGGNWSPTVDSVTTTTNPNDTLNFTGFTPAAGAYTLHISNALLAPASPDSYASTTGGEIN